MIKNRPIVVLILLSLVLSQTACYNNYFISKDELQKLESSSVAQKETVTVYGDCPEGTQPAATDANGENNAAENAQQAYRVLRGPLYAQAEVPTDSATDATPVEDVSGTEVVAVDAAAAPASNVPPGCVAVNVSTANPLVIVTKGGDDLRVTPFNFVISGNQVISPEYNLLENVDDVRGAEVSEFSTWKTVALISGIAAAAVGAFVGVSLISGENATYQK